MGDDGSLAWTALADPTRRTILRILAEHGELPAGDLASRVTTVGRTAVSGQLRVLRAAGLVRERRDGNRRLYSIQQQATDEVVQFLSLIYRDTLGSLKRTLEASTTTETGSGGSAHTG